MNLIWHGAEFVMTAWSLSGFILFWVKALTGHVQHGLVGGFRLIWAELRPLYLPAVTVYIGHFFVTGTFLGWNTWHSAMSIVAWWVYKDLDEDDRWKRRKAKLAAKVARKGTRLVVVPVSAGVR